MARGFLGGALAGGVLSAGVAVVASVLLPPPPAPEVDNLSPGETQAPEPVVAEGGVNASQQEDAPAVQSSQPSQAPEPDSVAALDADALAPAGTPSTGQAGGLASPGGASEQSDLDVSPDTPVIPNPQALAPMEPPKADGVAIDTTPADPPRQDPEVVEKVEEPQAGAEAPVEVAEPAVPAEEPLAEAENSAEATDRVDEAEPEERPEPPVASDSEAPVDGQQAENGSGSEPADVVVPEPEKTTPEVADAPSAEEPVDPQPTEPAETDQEDTQVAALTPTDRPQIGRPAISLTERDTGVAIRRPGVSEPEAEEQAAEDPEAAPAASDDPRPIGQFAQPFDNPENKPLMSIVLIDDGSNPTSGAAGIAALRSFPYTLNFAVDASLPDAAERMALYRQEGFEVLAMVSLPEGAQAVDAETTLAATLSNLNEVVAVLEGPGPGLQGGRQVSDQVSAILAETGHGLVTQSKGLNTMPKLARKQGVPAAPLFRDFDSKGQTATVIRRFLDQAAFKAAQEGAVIMQGRLRPDTISALLLWGLQDRAGKVALAPVSAALLRDEL